MSTTVHPETTPLSSGSFCTVMLQIVSKQDVYEILPSSVSTWQSYWQNKTVQRFTPRLGLDEHHALPSKVRDDSKNVEFVVASHVIKQRVERHESPAASDAGAAVHQQWTAGRRVQRSHFASERQQRVHVVRNALVSPQQKVQVNNRSFRFTLENTVR